MQHCWSSFCVVAPIATQKSDCGKPDPWVTPRKKWYKKSAL
ncbi:hypothetical protein JCM19300_3264 [Algibacter lectus]|uniref:Uncharacterized protein n=1 Tax=Algibacter lectus TaxID=221126 RepID=A0A090VH61_9FLAO|nr:hypothetical protein JCM19300_3264 [Algibacter lectus]